MKLLLLSALFLASCAPQGESLDAAFKRHLDAVCGKDNWSWYYDSCPVNENCIPGLRCRSSVAPPSQS